MKHNAINFFSILVLFVFAGSIFYFFNTIHTDYKNGLSRSEKIFREISTSAEKSPDQIKPEMFSEKDGILSAKYSKNNKTLIAFPDEQTSSQVINSKLVKVFYKTIVSQEDTYELKIAVYILRPNVIYNAARNSFIIILAATLVTIGMLIFISAKTKKVPNEEETEDNDISLEEEFNIKYETPAEETQEKQEENNQKNETSFDDIENIEEIDIPKEEIISGPESDNTKISETQEENPFAGENPEETPSDAYYNEHKIMQNAYDSSENSYSLKERINFELTKATSNEQDFSVLLIEIKNSEKFADIEKFLTDNYGKENVFNYKENTFALLKENTNIDEAEDKAALIENNIRTLYEEPNLAIGISSRSIRTITADRLLAEAEEALNHANNDPDSKIVGFHVDVEKYREFMENSKNQENNPEEESE